MANVGPSIWPLWKPRARSLGRIIRRFTCKADKSAHLQKMRGKYFADADVDNLDLAIEQSLIQLTETLITEILQREGCTQEALALRLGITPQHLSNLTNRISLPTRARYRTNWLRIMPSGSLRSTERNDGESR